MIQLVILGAVAALPAIAAVGLFVFALARKGREPRSKSAGAALLGLTILLGWLLAWALGFASVSAAAPAALRADNNTIITIVAYASYLAIGVICIAAPLWVGGIVIRLWPSGARSLPDAALRDARWSWGLRAFGIYMAAFAVLMTALNAGLINGVL